MMDDSRKTTLQPETNAASPHMPGLRTAAMITVAFVALLFAGLSAAVSGCGSEEGISQSQYEQVQKGMTLDEVEGLLGQPDRTHRTGSTSNPNIIWYYNKSEAEGLVRISFLNAKVDNLSPYDLSVNLDE